MVFTSRIYNKQKVKDKDFIFLAGSIDKNHKTDWRINAINYFWEKYRIYDPRITNHSELTDNEMKNHVEWELNALSSANRIILNFLSDAKSPISLLELGMYVRSKKLIVVCPKTFYKYQYVKTLCNIYNTPCFNKISDAIQLIQTK